MKRLLLSSRLVIIVSCFALAQNKTLGVGTSSPDPNPALHVESFISNQGFLLPRLTTAQRSATTNCSLNNFSGPVILNEIATAGAVIIGRPTGGNGISRISDVTTNSIQLFTSKLNSLNLCHALLF
jgi:hypothetical protein